MPKTQNKRIASLDLGSNSFILSIFEDDKVIEESLEIVRLSESLAQNKMISEAAIDRALQCLGRFQKIWQKHQCKKIIAAGTACFREAQNSLEFIEDIFKKFKLQIRVLSGQEEGQLSYLGIKQKYSNDNICIIDIGGASTEVIFDNVQVYSLNIGSVTLSSQKDLKSIQEKIEQEIEKIPKSQKTKAQKAISKTIAIAATATTLAQIQLGLEKYDREQIEGTQISKQEIESITEKLCRLDVENRKKIIGLDPKRAEVFPAALLILLACMEKLEIENIIVSSYGLRHGLLYEYLASI